MLVSSHLACAMEEPPTIQPQSSLAQRGGRGDAKETSASARPKYRTCCDTCGTLLTIDGGRYHAYHANRRRDLRKSCYDGLPYWPSKKLRVEGGRSYRLVHVSGDLEEDKSWYTGDPKRPKFEDRGADDPLEAERARVEAKQSEFMRQRGHQYGPLASVALSPSPLPRAPTPAPMPAPMPTLCRGLCGVVAHANPDPKWVGFCCGCC